jgi:predicted  nucleic acid-binding Zn-ribbon protein
MQVGSLEESLGVLRRNDLPLLQDRVESLTRDKAELEISVERLSQEVQYGKGKLAESEVRLSRTSESLDALRLSTDQEALTNKTVSLFFFFCEIKHFF